MSKFITDLNKPQQDAVLHNRGPALVLAGAGSGKTTVVTRRIARLVAEEHVDPASILGVTFTNKAAKEMKERCEKLLGHTLRSLWLTTFHSAAVRILRGIVGDFSFGRTASFEILDQAGQLKELKAILEVDLGLDTKDYKPYNFLSILQGIKDQGELPHEYDFEGYQLGEKLSQIARIYEDRLRELNAFDFGDLLLYTTIAFGQSESLKRAYSSRFQYILVDEYQDTNPVQLLFLDYLTCTHKNLMVVGDDFQAIYGWRAASVDTILNFPKDYPDTHVIKLEQNYRSTPQIVDASNRLIAYNTAQFPKNCFSRNSEGDKPSIVIHETERQEAWWVAAAMKQHHQRQQVPWKEMAVLYRTNSQSRVFEETLIAKGIPYNVRGSFKFYDREEIQDLLAYLKVLANPSNRLAWERIINKPTRGIGRTAVSAILDYAQSNEISFRDALNDAGRFLKGATLNKVRVFLAQFQTLEILAQSARPAALLKSIVDALKFEDWLKGKGSVAKEDEDRWNNVLELIRAVDLYEEDTPPEEISLVGLLERVALVSAEEDEATRDTNKVMLTTIHAAKGLEFKVVFVTGMEEGLMPHANSMHDTSKLEEERRLAYTAMTRAKKWLYLSYARSRWIFGKPLEGRRSRFIQETLDDSY